MVYAIYEGNMERLTRKMQRIQNKCRRYGCDFSFSEVGEEIREKTDELGRKKNIRFVLVDAEGTAIVNGWRYVASLEKLENGQNLLVKACDIEVPKKYYTAPIICEHCNINRARKNAYIVYNEATGEFKEVGTNCLCDFTHGLSAEGVAGYTAMFEELIAGEVPAEGGYSEEYFKLEEMLRYTAETIRIYGYEKSDTGMGTKGRFFRMYNGVEGNEWFFGRKGYREVLAEIESTGFNAESDYAKNLTQKALAWIAKQEESNNYMHNLKSICSLKYIKRSQFGVMVSLFPTFDRGLERENEKRLAEEKARAEAENSNYVGEVGKRIEVDVSEYKVVTGWETQFGYVAVYKLVDNLGNIYTWKTSSSLPQNVNKLRGTVKEHKEFRGVKQTELTRCKVIA